MNSFDDFKQIPEETEQSSDTDSMPQLEIELIEDTNISIHAKLRIDCLAVYQMMKKILINPIQYVLFVHLSSNRIA